MASACAPRDDQGAAISSPVAGRWAATGILSACFALSYIDRQVLSLLVPSIKAELDLNDGEIGLLQGISFSLFYVAASLPLAALADRRNRSRIAATCVAVWSVMTMLCGLAASFMQLLLARIGLAVAEAGLPPSALTLMNDLHNRHGLARATALFMLAPFVGGGIALTGGGVLLEWMRGFAQATPFSAWQLVFFCAGVPGLVIAPFVWGAVRDPRRIAAGDTDKASIRSLMDFMLGNWRFCIVYMLAIGVVIVVLNAHIAWMPAAILRRFPVGEGAMGLAFGVTYLIAGSIGTLGAGWITSRGSEATMLRRTLSLMRNGAMLLCLFAIIAPFAPGYAAMIALTGVAVLFNSGVIAMGSIPFQIAAPPQLRAQAIALTGLFSALIGTGLGPLATGLLSDALTASGMEHALSGALAIVCGTCAAIAAALMHFALRNAIAQRD